MRRGTICLICLGLLACQSVQPWERGVLAKQEMQWLDDPVESRLQSQIYSSKEASSGGGGASGGGCGCN
ncbi:MAG: DUF4266 domain-containing protein [Halieaceae bacterium]|nr:DUF4266 domain-containing protein [Halieaceae bacterium]